MEHYDIFELKPGLDETLKSYGDLLQAMACLEKDGIIL